MSAYIRATPMTIDPRKLIHKLLRTDHLGTPERLARGWLYHVHTASFVDGRCTQQGKTVSGGARTSNMGQCGPHMCTSGNSALTPIYVACLHHTMFRLGLSCGVPVKVKHKCMPKYTTCRTGGACACQVERMQSSITAQTWSLMCEGQFKRFGRES